MLSLSSPPGRTERSVSLAHAGEANPTYGEHVCSCAALSATRGLQVDVCYKRPPVCYEIISEAPNQTTDALISAIACWKWGDSCCRTETIHETSLQTSSGPRGRSKCRGKRQKPAVNPFAVLPCSRILFFPHSNMHDFKHLLEPTFTKYKIMHLLTKLLIQCKNAFWISMTWHKVICNNSWHSNTKKGKFFVR